jgi:enterochelin esterase-like enzyme
LAVRAPAASVAVLLILGVSIAHAALTRRSHRRPSRSPVPVAHASVGPSTVSIACPSASLGGALPALVYLPAGYGTSPRRYPVIYLLHGLPAGPQTYTESGFAAAVVAHGSRPAIVVAPQGARTENSDPEYLDSEAGENWPQAFARDLTRCVDAHFLTIAKRSGRAMIGFSAGGFGAMNIGLRHLDTYGVVESWSGYFEATDPSGQHKLNLGSPQANAAAAVPRGAGLKAAVNAHPALIAFYVGRQDDRFADDNDSFDRALARERIPHLFRTYPGGHSGALWTGESKLWLGYALSALARGA